MKHDPKKLTPSEAELTAAFNSGDFFAFGSGKSHNEVILERRIAELKERLAAAESLIEDQPDNPVMESRIKLYFGAELNEWDMRTMEAHPPTDPYLAKLWAKYQASKGGTK